MKKFLLSAAILLALPVFGMKSSQDLARSHKLSKIDELKNSYAGSNLADLSHDRHNYFNDAKHYYSMASMDAENGVQYIYALYNSLTDYERAYDQGLKDNLWENKTFSNGQCTVIYSAEMKKNDTIKTNIKNTVEKFLKSEVNNLSNREIIAIGKVFQHLKLSDAIKALQDLANSKMEKVHNKRNELLNKSQSIVDSDDELEVNSLEKLASSIQDDSNKKNELAIKFANYFFKEFPSLDVLCQEKQL